MSNVCFAFGPSNAYLCNSPSKWTRHNLPGPVEHLFAKQPPIKDVHELVLGPNNSYYMGYTDADHKLYSMHAGLPHNLTQWLAVNTNGYVSHDIRTTSISLGPNDSYVVKDKDRMQWCGVPDALAQHLRSNQIRLVTLGMDESFVVVNHNGAGFWNLKNRYQDVQTKLASLPHFGDIHYISLSSHHGISSTGGIDDPCSMLVLKNGDYAGAVPDNHVERFNVVLGALPNMMPPPPAPATAPLRAAVSAPAASYRPAPAAAAVRPVQHAPAPARVTAHKPSASNTANILKTLSAAAKLANAFNGGGGGGDSGGDSGSWGGDGGSWGGDGGVAAYDTGFVAGMQADTWSSVGDAGSDPIQ